ncbi:hypothetical protein [Cellulomonas sp. URHB0016]
MNAYADHAQQAAAHPQVADAPVLIGWAHAELCNVSSATLSSNMDGECDAPNGTVPPVVCPPGVTPELPLWVRHRATEQAPWTPWRFVTGGRCPEGPVPVMTGEDFRRLPIAPSPLHFQPDQGWVLVNIETIVYTEDAEQTFQTELFGVPVEVVATPSRFTWDFHDGSRPLTTTDPGRPWPAKDVFHVYESVMTAHLTLTTTWSGRFRVAGEEQWRDVEGTAQTSADSTPFEVVERRAHLVPTDCLTDPTQRDC